MAITWKQPVSSKWAIGVDPNFYGETDTYIKYAPKVYIWTRYHSSDTSMQQTYLMQANGTTVSSGSNVLSYDCNKNNSSTLGNGAVEITKYGERILYKTHGTSTIYMKLTFTDGYVYSASKINNTIEWSFSVKAKKSYSVTYNGNGGTNVPGTQKKWHDETLVLSSTYPTRSYYNFAGWNGTYWPGNQYTGNANLALTAHWTVWTHTVTYNTNGGSGSFPNQTKSYGTALYLHEAPTRTGYNFTGWKASNTDTIWGAGSDYTQDYDGGTVTMTAQWSIKTPSFDLNIYDPDGVPQQTTGTAGNVEQSINNGSWQRIHNETASSYAYNTSIRYRNFTPPTGRRLTSVSGATLGSDGIYYATMGESALHVNFYTAYNTYTVKYHANGGSGSMADSAFTYGTTANLRACNFSRVNHSFLGWATSATGGVVYNNSQAVSNLTPTHGGIINLYAVWHLDYIKPRIQNVELNRCDTNLVVGFTESSTWSRIKFNWATDKNVSNIRIEFYDISNNLIHTDTVSASGTSGNVDNKFGGGKLQYDKTYTAKILVTDELGSTTEIKTVTSNTFIIDMLPQSRGIAFGQAAEVDGNFEVNYKAVFKKGITDQNGNTIGSDIRLKENIDNIPNDMVAVWDKVELKSFNYKNNKDKISFGIIAQQLIELCREYGINIEDYSIINTFKTVDKGVVNEYYSIDYNAFHILTAIKVKEQQREIDLLKEEIRILKEKI